MRRRAPLRTKVDSEAEEPEAQANPDWIEADEWSTDLEELDLDLLQPRQAEPESRSVGWSAGIRARAQMPGVSEKEQRRRMSDWWKEVERGIDEGKEEEGGAEWACKVEASCLDPSQFQAGLIGARAWAWRELFERIAASKKPGSEGFMEQRDTKLVLGILERGYKPPMRSLAEARAKPEAEGPSFKKKLRLATQMVTQAVGAERAEELLNENRTRPGPIDFGNRKSVDENKEFVRESIVDMLKSGAVRRWADIAAEHGLAAAPTVINPLGVVTREVDGKIKRRLVLDIRYPNIFMKHLPFKFEKLSQIHEFLKKEGWICVSDFKSGYHHVPMDPSSFEYMAFEFDGEIFGFVVMPFGLMPAVYVFNGLVKKTYQCARMLGFQLCFYIDDRFPAYARRGAARWREEMLRKLFTLQGWYHALDKGQLEPQQEGPYLGFVVDSVREQIRVRESKIEELIRLIELAETQVATAREYARIAGKLLSMAPAIGLAPLFTQELYRVVAHSESWEALGRPTEVLALDLRYLRENLRRMNGNRWFPPTLGVRIKGDASDTGSGAHLDMRPGEESLIGPVKDMAWTLTPEEAEAGLSSTLREAMALENTVLLLLADESRRKGLKDRLLTYVSDNQGLVSGCNRMFSRVPAIAECYRRVWLECSKAGVHLKLEWVPREQNWRADELSKIPDPSAWGLPVFEFRRVCAELKLGAAADQGAILRRPAPAWDGFADEVNAKCANFCALYACSKKALVDAFCCGEMLRQVPGGSQRAIVWAFPPPDAIGRVIRWIEAHRLNVVLVYPVRPDQAWWPKMLWGPGAPPEALPVIEDVAVSSRGLVRGARVPKEIGAGWPRAQLRAALIIYDTD